MPGLFLSLILLSRLFRNFSQNSFWKVAWCKHSLLLKVHGTQCDAQKIIYIFRLVCGLKIVNWIVIWFDFEVNLIRNDSQDKLILISNSLHVIPILLSHQGYMKLDLERFNAFLTHSFLRARNDLGTPLNILRTDFFCYRFSPPFLLRDVTNVRNEVAELIAPDCGICSMAGDESSVLSTSVLLFIEHSSFNSNYISYAISQCIPLKMGYRFSQLFQSIMFIYS